MKLTLIVLALFVMGCAKPQVIKVEPDEVYKDRVYKELTPNSEILEMSDEEFREWMRGYEGNNLPEK